MTCSVGALILGLLAGVFMGLALWCAALCVDRRAPPRPVEPPPPAPFELILPARAGWGTMLDLKLTTVFRPSWAGEPIRPDRIIPIE